MSDTTETEFDAAEYEAVFDKFNDENASAPPEVLEDLSVPDDTAGIADEGGDVGDGEDADTGIAAHVGDSEDGIPTPEDVVPDQDPLLPPSAEGPGTDWFAPLEARLGRTLDERERAAALGVTADLLAADQARQQAAWQALYGTPAVQPVAEPAPAPDPLAELDELVDPEAAAILRQAMSPLQQQIEALTQAEAQRQAEYQQQQIAQRASVIDTAGAVWREKVGVDDATWDHLVAVSAQHTPTFDAFAQQTGGDWGAATQRLLDYLYWTDEKLRDAEVQRRLAAERAALQEDYVRQTRAASVSTAGSTTAPVAAPASEESELLNAIAARMSDGVPGDISN